MKEHRGVQNSEWFGGGTVGQYVVMAQWTSWFWNGPAFDPRRGQAAGASRRREAAQRRSRALPAVPAVRMSRRVGLQGAQSGGCRP